MLSTLSTRRFSFLTCFRRCRRGVFHFRHAFDVVDEAFFISDVLSTLSTRHFSLPMCFRRCRRGILHFGHAFDVVDEAFSTSDMLSTLSTRHSLLPTRNPVTISGFLILRVWFRRLFRIIWSFPLPFLLPRALIAGEERVENIYFRNR